MKKIRTILNSRKTPGAFLLHFLIIIGICGVFSSIAQEVKVETVPPVRPMPTPKVTVVVAPTPKPKNQPIPKVWEVPNIARNDSEMPAEKSIEVEKKVNISLCVGKGRVKINGWDRNEVRALVRDGSQVGFKVAEVNPKNEKPVWIFVLGFDPKKSGSQKLDECLTGEIIEIDVPREAVVNLKGRQSETRIESVAKVRVENISGNIFLNDISGGIEAATYQGGIMVENSSGSMTLSSTSGNIIVFDVRQSEFGDIFRAKTNSGAISLLAVGHRQIETSTISGATTFQGELSGGGQYGFGTQNGRIQLQIPSNAVCKVNAWYGFGAFVSEIQMQNTVKKEQSLSAELGTGESNCTIFLKTSSGEIKIKKQP